MGNVKKTYQIIEGPPSATLLEDILVLYKSIFDDYKLDFFTNRIHQKEDIVIALCYNSKSLIGFKIGYRYNDTTMYSWVGGVSPSFRQQGIAKELARIQEEYARQKNYSKLRTKSMNRFKPMMILNLKNGFDIVQVYTNDIGQTKVIFEKDLQK